MQYTSRNYQAMDRPLQNRITFLNLTPSPWMTDSQSIFISHLEVISESPPDILPSPEHSASLSIYTLDSSVRGTPRKSAQILKEKHKWVDGQQGLWASMQGECTSLAALANTWHTYLQKCMCCHWRHHTQTTSGLPVPKGDANPDLFLRNINQAHVWLWPLAPGGWVSWGLLISSCWKH